MYDWRLGVIERKRMFQYNIVLKMNINSQYEFTQVSSFDVTEIKEIILSQSFLKHNIKCSINILEYVISL